jgi:cytochrome c biogenesis protein CcdA
MFCHKCGKAEQLADSYCRQCGTFLSNPAKPVRREASPEQNLKANTFLSMITIITCFTLAILLYALLGFRESTHPMIYVTSGLLIAMGCWHIQTFIRMRQLNRQWKRRNSPSEQEDAGLNEMASFEKTPTSRQLIEPDLSSQIPASVTEDTTRNLVSKFKA